MKKVVIFGGAYQTASENGWLKEMVWLKDKKKPHNYWTKERVFEEISNIDQNGIAELAVDRGLIKKVRILQLNLARTKSLQLYEEYINKTYQLENLLMRN